MTPESLMKRFNSSKEELAKLGLEFNSEALPLLEKLHTTTLWILLNKKAAKKIIKLTFFEAVENCDITKNNADWDSWIHRIWMREILGYYSGKENDTQTVFDFIDHAKVKLDEVEALFKSEIKVNQLLNAFGRMPAVLRIPMIMKEIHSLNYERISDLIDVPIGVIATRIYRARKLLFLFLRGNFNFDDEKRIGIQQGSSKLIFELRKCALLVDNELSGEQKTTFSSATIDNILFKTEILIQGEIKKHFLNPSPIYPAIERIRAKIERKAIKRFGKQN